MSITAQGRGPERNPQSAGPRRTMQELRTWPTESSATPLYYDTGQLHALVGEGVNCLGNLGWTPSDLSGVPREDNPGVQFVVGRCLGILDAAILLYPDGLPKAVYEQQAGLYLVTLRPALVGYADCLAEACPDLEERIQAVESAKIPVYAILRDIVWERHDCPVENCPQPATTSTS